MQVKYSKSLFIVLNGLETNDRRIRDIAEHAESIHITEHSTREFNNFETNKMVIAAEGFLGFHDRLRIDYSYSCGECQLFFKLIKARHSVGFAGLLKKCFG